jgi:Type IX secretion system protein PorV
MYRLSRLIFILLILSFSAVETFGSGQNRAGTAAAPELRIPIGARYLAMVGSPIASVSGLEAIYWNPAGVDISPTTANAMFSYRQYIADMNMDFVAVSARLGGFGTVGLSFRSLNIGDINVTTMEQPDGNGQVISPSYFILGLTYSKQLTDRVSIGANFNVINESFADVSATGLSIDAGVEYNNLFDVQGFGVGVVVKNLGASMKYGGNGLFVNANDPNSSRGPTWYQVDAASADLPSEIDIGLSYIRNLDEQNKVTVAASFQNNNYTYDNYNLGLEYTYRDIFFVRGGYLFTPQATTETPSIWQNYALGVGFNLQQISNINLAVDYAYVPVKYFDANNVFSLKFGF